MSEKIEYERSRLWYNNPKESAMQTLHIRAQESVIDKIMEIVNEFSMKGEKVELLDNFSFDVEKKMIVKSLQEEKANDTIEHDKLWEELLK